MDVETLLTILQQAYPKVEFQLQGAGCNFHVSAIGEVFSGLSRVQRQQLLNRVLKPLLQQGELHAVSYQLLTPAEAQAVGE